MAEVLSFPRSLYRSDAVAAVAALYGDLARISVEEDGSHVRVTIADPEPDLADQIADAFANHALAESIRLYREERGGDL